MKIFMPTACIFWYRSYCFFTIFGNIFFLFLMPIACFRVQRSYKLIILPLKL
jgi:hypothetical protein